MSAQDPHYLIVGAGCIGVYIARKMQSAQPTWHITIKGRQSSESTSDQRKAHKQWVKALCENAGVTYCEQLAPATHYDGIIIATKSDDVQQAAQELASADIQSPQTLVLYNGIIPPLDPPLPGLVTRAVTPAGYAFDNALPSGIRLINETAPWRLAGDKNGGAFWHKVLTQAEQQADYSDDNAAFVVRKYLINTAVNPLTVIYQRKVDELLDDPVSQQRIVRILMETIDILHADQRFASTLQTLPEKAILLQESLNFIDTYRGHYTSAYHAFNAGDPVEIQALTGYAMTSGSHNGCCVSENQQVWDDIQTLLNERDQHRH